MHIHEENIVTQGKPLEQTGKALIMIHGRGASADSILSLSEQLDVANFTLFAPQASNHSWYPYSFMAPVAQNQPFLDSALALIDKAVKQVEGEGIDSKNIFLLGFSQGACLTAEYATRHARSYGGLLIFTGGLIGKQIDSNNYKGTFEGTQVLITTGDPDPHVPVRRVEETVEIMERMGAVVTKKIYKGRPHTILQEELDIANKILKGKA